MSLRIRHNRLLSGLTVWAIALTVGGGVYLITKASTSDQLVHDHNAIVCVFRKYTLQAKARSVQARDDVTQPRAARLRAEAAVRSADEVLSYLITVPRSFDCRRILKTL